MSNTIGLNYDMAFTPLMKYFSSVESYLDTQEKKDELIELLVAMTNIVGEAFLEDVLSGEKEAFRKAGICYDLGGRKFVEIAVGILYGGFKYEMRDADDEFVDAYTGFVHKWDGEKYVDTKKLADGLTRNT